MVNWPRMTYQKDKGRLYNDLGSRVDCKQSCAITIGTKIDYRAAKQQFCNKNWT